MCACFVCPEQSTVAVIERCGRYERMANPGCNIINPFFGDSVAGRLSLRIQQLDVRCDTKSRDNVFVKLIVSVQFCVEMGGLEQAFYRLTDTRAQITSYVFDVVRAIVPKIDLDNVFIAKEEIAKEVKDTLTKSMSTFGYQIIQTLVTDIEPDQKVRNAMNDINAAQRQRAAAMEKAEAEKIMVVKKAEASSEAKFLEGQGIARQRQAIVNGLRDSVKDFESQISDVSSASVLEMMMITQWFDTMKEVGTHHGNSTIFLNHSPGAIGNLAEEMRNGLLQGAAGGNRQQAMSR